MRKRGVMACVIILTCLAVPGMALASGANPQFSFSTDEAGGTFSCALDSGASSSCTSPTSYSNLASGQHTATISSTFTVPTATSSSMLLGDNNIEGTADGNPSNSAQAWSYTATASGTASSVSFYVDSGNGASAVQLGLYSNANAAPGTLLGSASLSSPKAGAWNTATLSGGVSVASGTKYWLAVLGTQGGSVAFRDNYPGTGCSTVVSNRSNLTALPQTFSKGKNWNAYCPASFYVTTAPVATGSNPQFSFGTDEAGATFSCAIDGGAASSCTSPKGYSNLAAGQHKVTITSTFTVPTTTSTSTLLGDSSLEPTSDANPSNSAQAWSYTATASGSAGSIAFYVDSGNSAPALQLGLYSDLNGAPGTLLGSANVSSPKSGAWDTAALSGGPSVTSGTKYWLAVLGTGGGSVAFRDNAAGTGCATVVSSQSNLVALQQTFSKGMSWNSYCPASFYLSGSGAQAPASSPPPPGNTVAPSVSGQMVQGDTLAASSGSWSNSPSSYGYQWEDCDSSGVNCSNIANATSSGYTLAAGDVGDMVRVMVTASNSGGSGQAASAAVGPVTGSGGSGGLPSGVSLQQIDGGPSYYCSNGFGNACSAGWDNASFFPILDDYAFYPGNSTTTFKALGLTSTVRVTGDENMSTLRSAGVTAIAAGDSASNFGSETVGGHVEEPSNWSDITSQANSLNSLFGLSGRFLQGSFTWNQLYYEDLNGSVCGGSGTMTMQQVFSCTSGMPGGKHLNIATDDLYYFAGSGSSDIQYTGGNVENNGGTATAAQMSRGSNYGDMVDIMRGWLQSPAQDAPIAPYIETEDGLLTGPGVREITPPELNWAVWSTILHGARMVIYFGTTSNYGSGSTFGFSQSTLPGQSVSMYTQGQDTNKLVENLAPIINSPFAVNYGSVTPAGYTFPTENLGWKSTSGIDVMTKYYTGGSFTNSSGTFGNGFYIIASPRAAETATNIAATFTIPGNYSGPVNVIDSSTGAPTTSTLNVSNHKITDTFAHAYDTQIIGPIPNQ